MAVGMKHVHRPSKDKSGKVLLVAQEISFAKVLAGNDKRLRDRGIKKLRKWLMARSKGGLEFTDDDFLRIWKGLYYCMWMADKLLVQEELAEAISNLIHCVRKNHLAVLFIRCFFQTMVLEWYGIDQFRYDKFMLLVRRFLRQTFQFCCQCKWQKGIVRAVGNSFTATILSTTDSAPPISLVTHFCDIYLQELAKVGRKQIPVDKVTLFLEPFIKHLSAQDNSFVRNRIILQVFHYLMKQSDAAFEFTEKFKAWKNAGCPGDSWKDMIRVEDKVDNMEDREFDESDEEMPEDRPLDPRAGSVNVELPVLPFDARGIANALMRQTESCQIRKHRSVLRHLANLFIKMTEGDYPLASQELKRKSRPVVEKFKPKKLVRKAAMELYKLDELVKEERWKRKKEQKKMYKKLKKMKGDEFDKDEDIQEECEEIEDSGIAKKKRKEMKAAKQHGMLKERGRSDILNGSETSVKVFNKGRKLVDSTQDESDSEAAGSTEVSKASKLANVDKDDKCSLRKKSPGKVLSKSGTSWKITEQVKNDNEAKRIRPSKVLNVSRKSAGFTWEVEDINGMKGETSTSQILNSKSLETTVERNGEAAIKLFPADTAKSSEILVETVANKEESVQANNSAFSHKRKSNTFDDNEEFSEDEPKLKISKSEVTRIETKKSSEGVEKNGTNLSSWIITSTPDKESNMVEPNLVSTRLEVKEAKMIKTNQEDGRGMMRNGSNLSVTCIPDKEFKSQETEVEMKTSSEEVRRSKRTNLGKLSVTPSLGQKPKDSEPKLNVTKSKKTEEKVKTSGEEVRRSTRINLGEKSKDDEPKLDVTGTEVKLKTSVEVRRSTRINSGNLNVSLSLDEKSNDDDPKLNLNKSEETEDKVKTSNEEVRRSKRINMGNLNDLLSPVEQSNDEVTLTVAETDDNTKTADKQVRRSTRRNSGNWNVALSPGEKSNDEKTLDVSETEDEKKTRKNVDNLNVQLSLGEKPKNNELKLKAAEAEDKIKTSGEEVRRRTRTNSGNLNVTLSLDEKSNDDNPKLNLNKSEETEDKVKASNEEVRRSKRINLGNLNDTLSPGEKSNDEVTLPVAETEDNMKTSDKLVRRSTRRNSGNWNVALSPGEKSNDEKTPNVSETEDEKKTSGDKIWTNARENVELSLGEKPKNNELKLKIAEAEDKIKTSGEEVRRQTRTNLGNLNVTLSPSKKSNDDKLTLNVVETEELMKSSSEEVLKSTRTDLGNENVTLSSSNDKLNVAKTEEKTSTSGEEIRRSTRKILGKLNVTTSSGEKPSHDEVKLNVTPSPCEKSNEDELKLNVARTEGDKKTSGEEVRRSARKNLFNWNVTLSPGESADPEAKLKMPGEDIKESLSSWTVTPTSGKNVTRTDRLSLRTPRLILDHVQVQRNSLSNASGMCPASEELSEKNIKRKASGLICSPVSKSVEVIDEKQIDSQVASSPALNLRSLTNRKQSTQGEETATPTKSLTPASSKKVNIALSKNSAQNLQDYRKSVRSSPAIPFDASKQPGQGVLKPSPLGGRINPFYRFSKRKMSNR